MNVRMYACVSAVLALCVGTVQGQVDPTPVAEQPPAQLEPIADIDGALARARVAYRAGPLSEQISLRVRFADGRERSSQVTLQVDAPADAGKPRRLMLDLGRFAIDANDSRIVAVSPQEDSLYFQAPVSGALSLKQLWETIPPVPLPQLVWSLSDDGPTPDIISSILAVSWIEAQHRRDLSVMFAGVSPGGPASASFSNAGRLLSLAIPLSKDGTRLEMTVIAIEPAPLPWSISTSGRTRVVSITELRQKPPRVAAGERLPPLSLMTRDLDPFSLDGGSVARDSSGRPLLTLLVVYLASQPAALLDAQAAARAIAAIRPHILTEAVDSPLPPRLMVEAAGFLELGDVSRAHIASIDGQWNASSDSGIRRAYSPAGEAELKRLTNGADACVLLLDADQKILSAIPLSGRARDDAGITRDVVAAVVGAVRAP